MDFLKNAGNKVLDAALKSLIGNEKNSRAISKDLADEIKNNVNNTMADIVRVYLHEIDRPSQGYREGYGVYPINRNDLLKFKTVGGLLTFEKIKSFLPKNRIGNDMSILLYNTEDEILIEFTDDKTGEIINPKTGLADFLFACLYQGSEQTEKIHGEAVRMVEEMIGDDDLTDTEERENDSII